MRSKLAINLTTNYSINFNLPKRSKKKIIFAKTSTRNNVNIALNLKLGFIITNLNY